jgi:hypothetical protein
MVAALALAFAALRAGQRIRRVRRSGARRTPDMRTAHLKWAKPAVVLVLIGAITGPVSMALLRGESPLGTLHAWLGIAVALLFGAAGVVGRRLEHGRGASRDVHTLLAVLAVLAGGAAAVAGFNILP